jgi:hypothetical protein
MISVSGSIQAGQYLSSSGYTICFTNDANAASRFMLNEQGRMYDVSSGIFLNINNKSIFTVYLNAEAQLGSFGYQLLTCSTGGGKLTCSTVNGNDGFYYCSNAESSTLLFGFAAGAAQYQCDAPLSLSTF